MSSIIEFRKQHNYIVFVAIQWHHQEPFSGASPRLHNRVPHDIYAPLRASYLHRQPHHTRFLATSIRSYSQQATTGPVAPDYLNEAELHVFNKIKGELDPVKLEVQDISGGCGSMYAIEIESPKFAGLTVIKQHKLVNEVLKEEIAKWHGVQLRTRAA
ncbi:hypothetical protein HBI88_142880 [Parastagonospora nodorum]|nr:hypothetical protein HBH47_154710 [Parastagonospora nodorum]KAH4219051.1 hypothetical protein HBI06_190670 [Parastagonospora nodorum]KAH4919947.1 hypothetical protein HBI79_197180 [Parastagonospora nodorum]KAH5072930.1 hypothetical protein HBH95_158040 [Parastagonospora nodorum]KAH5672732.1 hypothetical protein HBI21_159750 [Parastagonospora nodorum]